MGLGSLLAVSLAQARGKAAECRRVLADGVDPIEARSTTRARQALQSARTINFGDCAERFIKSHQAGWKNEKHVGQWHSTIKTYCAPVFGPTPVQHIDTALVLEVLEPIWTRKPETAGRVRGRVERVLDWAKAREYRDGENPARWRGHLDKATSVAQEKPSSQASRCVAFQRYWQLHVNVTGAGGHDRVGVGTFDPYHDAHSRVDWRSLA